MEETREICRSYQSRTGIDRPSSCSRSGKQSPTVTAFYAPERRASEIQEKLRTEFGIHISKGFGEYRDSMLRIGHFGNISASEVLALLGSLEIVVRGSRVEAQVYGKAVETALPILRS